MLFAIQLVKMFSGFSKGLPIPPFNEEELHVTCLYQTWLLDSGLKLLLLVRGLCLQT